MYKFMMIFNKPPNMETFENRYNDLLALVERMPHITRRQVINVYGSPMGASRIYRILEVYFDSRELMEESLKSKSGQEAGAEISRFPQRTYEVVFAEVYEEAGDKRLPRREMPSHASVKRADSGRGEKPGRRHPQN